MSDFFKGIISLIGLIILIVLAYIVGPKIRAYEIKRVTQELKKQGVENVNPYLILK